MKGAAILVMIILFFCSCNSSNSKLNTDNQLTKDTVIKISNEMNDIRKSTSDTIPPTQINRFKTFSFKFNVDTSAYILKSINIYAGNILIQKIIANKSIDYKNFKLIDWNFDGYKDISVLCDFGATGNCAYFIWNYDSKSNTFKYNKELSEKLGLEIDSLSKSIIFHYRAGWKEEYWDTLKYENNKLAFKNSLFRKKWYDGNGNLWVKNTFSKKINNKMIIKKDSFIYKDLSL